MSKFYKKIEENLEKLGGKVQAKTFDYSKEDVRNKIMKAVNQEVAEEKRIEKKLRIITSKIHFVQRFKLVPIGVAIALVLVAGVGAVYASDDAVPGDVLYRVDRSVENIHYKFIRHKDKRAEFRLRQAEERTSELEFISQIHDQYNSIRGNEEASLLDVQEAVIEARRVFDELKVDEDMPINLQKFDARIRKMEERIQMRIDKFGADASVSEVRHMPLKGGARSLNNFLQQ